MQRLHDVASSLAPVSAAARSAKKPLFTCYADGNLSRIFVITPNRSGLSTRPTQVGDRGPILALERGAC